MPITVACSCGKSYTLKDEMAGKLVKCEGCGKSLRVEAGHETLPQADPAFDRDKFLLRQKHLAISEKYYVWDEKANVILYVERPAHLARNFFALFAGLVCAGVVGAALGALAAAVSTELLKVILGISAGLGSIAAFVVAAFALYEKRHITFYRDDSKRERLLEILQDKKLQFIRATYTVRDPAGSVLARLSKNYVYNVIRKRWHCYAPDGSLLCVAKEDSIILSLMRRLLGPLLGILRTNFVLLDAAGESVIGEFNRKFTILDRYVLDMGADRSRALDRRIALALGVMLDTGERR